MSTISDIKRASASAMNTMYSGIPVHGLPDSDGPIASLGLTAADVEYQCGRIADEIREYFEEQEREGTSPDDCIISVALDDRSLPCSLEWFGCFGGANVLVCSSDVPAASRLADPDYLYEYVYDALCDFEWVNFAALRRSE